MGRVSIVDLSRAPDALSRRVLDHLRQADTVIVPTGEGVPAAALRESGIAAESYADHGMSAGAPADEVVEALRPMAERGDVSLAVAGYPFLREGIVTEMLRRIGPVRVLPASSPLEVLLLAFDVDSTADLDLVDAAVLKTTLPERGSHLVITQVANSIAAKTVSKRLADLYPNDHPVVVAVAEEEGLYELSLASVGSLSGLRVSWPDATLYVPPFRLASPGGFDELVRIMAVLRGPDGCPWDLEQTHMSLRRHLIEESYEVAAAVENGDMGELADELGDILLQVVFHAQIAAEAGDFSIDDSVAAIIAKLRRRHPHIFGSATADTPAEVSERWDRIKREEKPDAGVLGGIAHTLPALTYADKVSRRAVGVGFEWETVEDVWKKVHEEMDELKATQPGTPEAADEVGDLLFTVVNVARKMGVDPEEALRGTCKKFRTRFERMERSAAEQGREMSDLDIGEMEALWGLAKEEERGRAGEASIEEGQA